MDRATLISRFLEVAAQLDSSSPEVATAIRQTIEGKDIPRTWLVRWNCGGYEWDHNSASPERIIGHAWVLATCGWTGGLPGIIPEHGRYQAIWFNQVEPLNRDDLEDAKRARQLGLHIYVQPKYEQPNPACVTVQEAFEEVVRTARPMWVDDAPRGRVVIGYQLGHDDVDHSIYVPVFGAKIEHGPSFAVEGVPQEWIGTYSHLTAFSDDGSTKFDAELSNGGGGPVYIADVPSDAEWRIPRPFVEQLLNLMEEASKLCREEEQTAQQAQENAERTRLAEKFGFKSKMIP